MTNVEMHKQIADLKDEVQHLKLRLNEMEVGRPAQPILPQTALLNERFLTRAFAVFGHYIVASLIILLPIYIVVLVMFGANAFK